MFEGLSTEVSVTVLLNAHVIDLQKNVLIFIRYMVVNIRILFVRF